MKTTRLKRFWRLLERLCQPATVERQWQQWLQEEYDLVRGFLRPQPQPAESYPKIGFHRCPLPYRVVAAVPGCYKGICDVTGDTIGLSVQDLVLYEIDRRAVQRAVTAALGIRPGLAPVERLPTTSQLGTQSPGAGRPFPVFFTAQREATAFEHVVSLLCVQQEQPFLLASPTEELCSAGTEALLRHHPAAMIPLRDAVIVGSDGAFHATPAYHVMLADFCRIAVPAAQAAPEAEPACVFRQDGPRWDVRFEGRGASVPDGKGMHQLRYTLAHRGQSIPSLVLLSGDSRPERPKGGSAGELLDDPAVRRYRERRNELIEELEEAQRHHDPARAEHLQVEIEQLTAELSRAVGLGGRKRQRSDAERARVSVKMAMERALVEIERRLPELARHFRLFLTTGHLVCYNPQPPIDWTLS
jgi:hypothetical protein